MSLAASEVVGSIEILSRYVATSLWLYSSVVNPVEGEAFELRAILSDPVAFLYLDGEIITFYMGSEPLAQSVQGTDHIARIPVTVNVAGTYTFKAVYAGSVALGLLASEALITVSTEGIVTDSKAPIALVALAAGAYLLTKK